MGFNNDGAEAVAARLAQRGRRSVTDGGPVLGVNIGKSKVVPEDEAARDYEKSARLLAPYADYLVVNVSSPNTPGLRNLQAVEKLEPILRSVRGVAGDVPLLVKIAPDLSDDDIDAVAELAAELGLDGIVAVNTTIGHDLGPGGLSGPPVLSRGLDVVARLRNRLGPDAVIIGVGGITTPADAREYLAVGATLVQGYTGLVYEGPAYASRIARALAADEALRSPARRRAVA
jgi:dihydroorotate dehydrogenase